MQPQCREVRVKNDEYERAAVPREANKARGCLRVQKHTHILKLNIIRMLCFPSHTFHTSLHMHDRPISKARATPTN